MNVDFKAHFDKASLDIEKLIPDPKYDGLAVLDFEHWRPIYTQNWMGRVLYRSESTREEREKDPKLNMREAQLRGKNRFEKAAKEFMLETLRLGKTLRPKATWGFYDFPICNNDVGSKRQLECEQHYYSYANEMWWLLQEVDALFPPVYFYKETNKLEEAYFVHAKTKMANDTKNTLLMPNLKIFLFGKLEYEPYKKPTWFYSQVGKNFFHIILKDSLCNTYGYTGDLGYDGIIIWSTSQKMKDRCDNIATYLKKKFGPFKEEYTRRSDRCREKLCSTRGRCVLKDEFADPQKYSCESGVPTEHFYCKCDVGFTGSNCEIPEAVHRRRMMNHANRRNHLLKKKSNRTH